MSVAFLFASFRLNHGLTYGNPVYLVSGLLLFVTTDLSSRRRWLHAILLFVAIVLKPQVSLPFAVLFFFRSRAGRHLVFATIGLLAVFTASTLVYAAAFPATANWREGLARNLHLGLSPGLSMSASYRAPNVADDSMLHLQYLFGYWIDNAHISETVALVTAVVLLGLLVWPLLRYSRTSSDIAASTYRWSEDLYLTLAAGTALWMFLPVYHRWSDLSMMAIVLLWALRFTFTERRYWQTVVVLVLVVVVVWKSWLAKMYPVPGHGLVHATLEIIFYRGDAIIVLLMTLLTIRSLWRLTAESDET